MPRLKIGKDLNMLDEGGYKDLSPMDIAQEEEEQEEYLLPDDFNMFPLVEKFTVRHHSHDMQHWAGVVMRNLCRKDDDKGGSGNAHTINAENGSSIPGNLPSAGAVDGPNIVVRNVKRLRGCIIDTGARSPSRGVNSSTNIAIRS